jgi:hypothetical protein
MSKLNIKKMIMEELELIKEANYWSWSKANLSDQDLSLLVALYNNYSGEPKKSVEDYQSINLEMAKMYFDEYINGTEASPNGKKVARKILTKLWKIN